MENYKELIGDDCWDIIQDYKEQLDISEKYNNVLNELCDTYKYEIVNSKLSDNLSHSSNIIVSRLVNNYTGWIVETFYSNYSYSSGVRMFCGEGLTIDIEDHIGIIKISYITTT